MVIIDFETNTAQEYFIRAKKILSVSKKYKPGEMVEITVVDGKVLMSGSGFIFEWEAFTTGSCKLSFPIVHWVELIKSQTEKRIKIVISEGEAMVGRVTVKCNTTFFETDKIFRSIYLPANPKAIDYLLLEHQGHTKEEIAFNGLEAKIEWAKKGVKECIHLAAINLNPLRISEAEVKDMVLGKLREKEKIDLNF